MPQPETPALEAGAYDLIRQRLETQTAELRARMDRLNEARRALFGAREPSLVATNHLTTENNCLPRDMAAVGSLFLFGYNVHIGLRTGIRLEDVFSVYRFDSQDHSFHPQPMDLLRHPQFEEDFTNLYKYYKDTVFAKFALIGPHLFMVFRTGKAATDLKTFKWALGDGRLDYLGNRFDHEFRFPEQHEFKWKRTQREMQRKGEHPHISIEDRIFVETIGGDFTIKVEDNTRSGQGIYSEPVERADQTLDDADIAYAIVGNLIVLKVRPYQERDYRYVIVNEKMKEALRVDALEEACVLLPDLQGLIFSNGYYLQTGEYKLFDKVIQGLQFERRIASPNGEDYLYMFYNHEKGIYVLLPYNLVEQQVDTPIVCNGFSLFPDGELCYFRAEEEPGRHHTLQIWRTPYGAQAARPQGAGNEWLARVGNKDLVKGLAECRELLVLTAKPDPYASLYVDVVKKAGDILDGYYWIKRAEAFDLAAPLKSIRETSSAAIEEFEKVRRLQAQAKESVGAFAARAEALLDKVRRHGARQAQEFVDYLAQLRALRGEAITLRELRYADQALLQQLETRTAERLAALALDCAQFLMKPEALQPYEQRAAALQQAAEAAAKVVDANQAEAGLDAAGKELELLIETVSGLPIEDATQTTAVIDRISVVFSRLNAIRSALRQRRTEMRRHEAQAEFHAQLRLLAQTASSQLERSDTPEACEAALTRVMVQIEEMEGKFADFEGFVSELAARREELFQAFDGRRMSLVEARNRRASGLSDAGARMLNGIRQRLGRFGSAQEINAYLASDLMVSKVRDLMQQLRELNDPVRADDLQNQLQLLREQALRALRDRSELYEDGDRTIRFGRHRFSVHVQPVEATLALRGDEMCCHLTGTRLFEPVRDEAFLHTRPVWNQQLVSENPEVYRAEYLAYTLMDALPQALTLPDLEERVRTEMAGRYDEGYVKGIHDADAARLLDALIRMRSALGLLAYSPEARTLARLCWLYGWDESARPLLEARIRSAGAMEKLFPESREAQALRNELEAQIRQAAASGWGEPADAPEAAAYLFSQLAQGGAWAVSQPAADTRKAFDAYLRQRKAETAFHETLQALSGQPVQRWQLALAWMRSFAAAQTPPVAAGIAVEAAALASVPAEHLPVQVHPAPWTAAVTGLAGEHPLIQQGTYQLDYLGFKRKMHRFGQELVPAYRQYTALRAQLVHAFASRIRLDSFKAKPMAGFVRNRLIDEVYLPLIGANLAKQIGTADEQGRSDRMGMLLLISPPGYGKTTLIEYVAQRLGLMFMKINGPALGHSVTSLDPGAAPNAAAREELEKLNLAFEMGENVMIYLDDIQHTHPEFLQKFISLCDAQRKIEGVYQGESRTYDFRGRRVAMVMAGNPYTESGELFQIPDMLANRADTYNLGDMLGGHEAAFRLSYLENALTANATLAPLAARPQADVQALIQAAETGEAQPAGLSAPLAADELQDSLQVLRMMLTVRDIVLKVNQAYIYSAAQADLYRSEPPFRLQGSYRNMSRLAEKISPLMNEAELQSLVLSHYEAESQTLTRDAEANLLKFKQLTGYATEADQARWAEICRMFREQRALNADHIARVAHGIGQFTEHVAGIRQALDQVLKPPAG